MLQGTVPFPIQLSPTERLERRGSPTALPHVQVLHMQAPMLGGWRYSKVQMPAGGKCLSDGGTVTCSLLAGSRSPQGP